MSTLSPETCYIYTYTGIKFFPLLPESSLIRVEDIAHALSNICRFTGHVATFYSVAQHSVYVSQDRPKKLALAGLLHDASEAYLCDVSSPVKKLDSMKPYRSSEAQLQKAIYECFGVPYGEPPKQVKDADTRVYRTEVLHLMPYEAEGEKAIIPNFRAWSPKEAELAFLERYATIVGKKGAKKPA